MNTAARLPFVDLRPGEDAPQVEAAIRRVIARGWFILGPEVEAFEHEFASAVGLAHAVGVATGTDALTLSLRALGIGTGDKVITTPLSAAYTVLAIMLTGARPVFADLDQDCLTIDPAAIEAMIGPRTAAILPVHLYGQAADMRAITAVAGRHGLAIVEDCCQAHLATCDGRPVGSFGAAAAFSFYPTKNLGALGDGGAVGTNDAALASRITRLRNGGQTDRYVHAEFGINSRLDELQAAVLRARLPFLPSWIARRRALAGQYRRELALAPVMVPPKRDAGHAYHLFPVRSTSREALRQHLFERGIETLTHYPVPLPKQAAFASERPAACPIADHVCAEVLSLPLHPALEDASMSRVASAVRTFATPRASAPHA